MATCGTPAADPETEKRRRRMGLLSLSDPLSLEAFVKGIGGIPRFFFLKKPASGLVMVRGRMGGTGKAFNIGEMLVSRCIINLDGHLGYGYTPFENLRHCELAAILDALSCHPAFSERAEGFLAALEDGFARKTAREASEAGTTRVEFFTVKRGEDD